MSFISYAQNFEDVLLWRALGHIEHGFYIDVGANDPVLNSVSKAFYDAGWRGVNIEPLPAFHQGFLDQRPRDVNLALAAGARDGELTLFDVPAVNGWASPDPAVADAYRARGFEIVALAVPMRTLASVCEEHVRGQIHFLKIDVEGYEGDVLRGMDFGRWRPWLLVIEATLPNSRVPSHAAWEGLVTGHGYRFAHFDGLNRYYAAPEHSELLAVLALQPNVFDDFIPYQLDSAWRAAKAAAAALDRADARLAQAAALQQAAKQRAEQAFDARALADADNLAVRAQLAKAEADHLAVCAQLAKADADNHAVRAQLAQAAIDAERAARWGRELEQRVLALTASTSWRITGPLRAAPALLRRFKLRQLTAHAMHALRRLLLRLASSERTRRLLVPLLRRFPGRTAQLSTLLAALRRSAPAAKGATAGATKGATKGAAGGTPQACAELDALPVSARKVLADLQRCGQPGAAPAPPVARHQRHHGP